MSDQEFHRIGAGAPVFEDPAGVEGPVRWLDSPQAVMDFVTEEGAADAIIVVRGGTTTFLTPALTAGIRGVVTLQGAPESHLGILAREYGIPAIMGVTFERGVRSARGETIPADGTRVRLDISGPTGVVLAEPGARESDEGPDAPEGMSPEQQAQIQLLLTRYRGEIPHGSDGDAELRSSFRTGVLDLTDESVHRDLSTDEVNELSRYAGWNMWDCLAARATEGESGLIPRQEYESVSFVQCWQRYPEMLDLITGEVGVDGLIEIGARARHEVGTKVNLLHHWALGFAVAFGRGVALDLGAMDPGDRAADLRRTFELQRRLYKGTWGDGPMFTSMRGYAAPLLDQAWLDRFERERTDLDDPERRARFQRFNASTEMMGFLLHFDNRSGLSDTGPYRSGAGFTIVRDHFLSEDVYQWGQLAPDLPYAVTQAMYFEPDEPIDLQLVDISTLFTKPANYLRHLKAVAVYARDRWDTPVEQIRLLDADGMERIQQACDRGTRGLYPHIAAMSRREKIMAGAKVYYSDFILPYARAAGVWDRMVAERDFFEIDPLTSEAYYRLVTDGAAAEMVPRLFLTGAGFPEVPAASSSAPSSSGGSGVDLAALHVVALRGATSDVPGDADALVAAGLLVATGAGHMLTEDGRTTHDKLLAEERATLDLDALARAYDRFLALNGPFKALCGRISAAGEDERLELIGDVEEVLDRVEPTLARTSAVVGRFHPYNDRLRAALAAAEAGDLDHLVSPRVPSVHTVWMELHEDYLQTLGRDREAEGSW